MRDKKYLWYLSPKTQEICISCVNNFNTSALASASAPNSLSPIAQSPKRQWCTICRTSAHTSLADVRWLGHDTPSQRRCLFSPPFVFRLSPLTYPDTLLWWHTRCRGQCARDRWRNRGAQRYRTVLRCRGVSYELWVMSDKYRSDQGFCKTHRQKQVRST